MKLTIKNPEKIVNQPLPTGFGGWVVSGVKSTEEQYEFWCENANGQTCAFQLNRAPMYPGLRGQSYAWVTTGQDRSVTKDWFSDMGNALSEIADIIDGGI